MITRMARPSLTALVVLVLTGPAAAQSTRIEVSGGYQATRVPDETLPLGWIVDVAIKVHDRFAAVAEVSGAYKTVPDENLGVDVDLSLHTWAFGPRWYAGRIGRILPYVQLMVGAERASATAQILQTAIGDSRTSFMLQPGGGVNVQMSNTIGVLGQFDYRRVFLDNKEDGASGENRLRIAVGLRFSF
jgi:hypothetical protein